MSSDYDKFRASGIDLGALGAAPGGEAYFCTPRGAQIIGSEGADGVHYCFAPGYGDTVFAVSPGNAEPDYVRAVARSFTDFLRLLLACGHSAAVEQCGRMTREGFSAYLAGNAPSAEAREIMDAVSEIFGLSPMEDPWGYIHELQSGFDYGGIHYTDPGLMADMAIEAEPEREWAVYYSGGLWGGGEDGGRPGAEISLRREFAAFGSRWTALSAYACEEGLVLDVAREVEPMSLRAFMERHGLGFGGSGREPDRAERLRMEAENPMELEVRASVAVNGRELRESGGSGTAWLPLAGAENGAEARRFVERYGLDADYCQDIRRLRFDWDGPREIESLTLRLAPEPVRLPGAPFRARAGGEIGLIHPLTGAQYTLRVNSVKAEEGEELEYNGHIFPNKRIRMEYETIPGAPGLDIEDCRPGDPPRRTGGGDGAVCGASAMLSGGEGERCALSSAYFELPEDIVWLPVWRVERGAEAEFKLV